MTASVLVVDDLPANITILEAKLSAEYFEVCTARSGAEALEVVKREHPDLLLLDEHFGDLVRRNIFVLPGVGARRVTLRRIGFPGPLRNRTQIDIKRHILERCATFFDLHGVHLTLEKRAKRF